MARTNIEDLGQYGQSVWLDHIDRSMIREGKLAVMIKAGLRGAVLDPAALDRAIAGSRIYDAQIEQAGPHASPYAVYDRLMTMDVQEAADMFLPIFRKTKGRDGYVSLEINPYLADNAPASIEEGLRLQRLLNRPNIMFNVPATEQGFRAVEELTAAGLNINVTQIFTLAQYMRAVQAYMQGVGRRLRDQEDVRRLRSSTSVRVGNIDDIVDRLIDRCLKERVSEGAAELAVLRGAAGAANAVLCFDTCRRLLSSDDMMLLTEQEANAPRLLWDVTGGGSARKDDAAYAGRFIAQDTITVLTETAFNAFLEHGKVVQAMPADSDRARATLEGLVRRSIDVDMLGAQLLKQEVRGIERSFTSLLNTLSYKAHTALA